MRKSFLILLLTPWLAACPPPDIEVRAAFVGGALAFVAADRGDEDAGSCWSEASVIDDQARPVWRFRGAGTGECRPLLPLYYGTAPDGAETLTPAQPLEPGRLYLFVGDSIGGVYGAFALSRAGPGKIVHPVDSDSPVALKLRDRWWKRDRDAPPAAPTPVSPAPAG